MAGAAGRLIAPLLLALAGAAGPAAPDPARALAGRYDREFADGMVDGSTYAGRDVVEVVPVGPRAAYVRFALDFYNGHSCGLSGVAGAEGAALVYRDRSGIEAPGRPPCVLTIRRDGAKLAWSDGEAASCRSYCGARGVMTGDLPWASRRPIRYLARLRASREYGDALRNWRRSSR